MLIVEKVRKLQKDYGPSIFLFLIQLLSPISSQLPSQKPSQLSIQLQLLIKALKVKKGSSFFLYSLGENLLPTPPFQKKLNHLFRGITLDLGFSAFVMNVPERLKAQANEYTALQYTLVDCPGFHLFFFFMKTNHFEIPLF